MWRRLALYIFTHVQSYTTNKLPLVYKHAERPSQPLPISPHTHHMGSFIPNENGEDQTTMLKHHLSEFICGKNIEDACSYDSLCLKNPMS